MWQFIILFTLVNLIAVEICWSPRFTINKVSGDLLLFYSTNGHGKFHRKYKIIWKNTKN